MNSNLRRFWRLLAVVLAFGLIAAACGDSDDDAEPAATTVAAAEESTDDDMAECGIERLHGVEPALNENRRAAA